MGLTGEEELRGYIYGVSSLAEGKSRQGFLLPLGPRQLFIFPAVKQPPASAVGRRAALHLEDALLCSRRNVRLYLEIIVPPSLKEWVLGLKNAGSQKADPVVGQCLTISVPPVWHPPGDFTPRCHARGGRGRGAGTWGGKAVGLAV